MKKTILIADDHADIVAILKRRCEALGLNVVTATSAMETLSVAEVVDPDAIVIDVHMPEGNGLTVCEMMAHHQRLKSIPVIVLTGHSSADVVKRCHELCAYYVPKTTDMWRHVEPVVCELLDIQATSSNPPAIADAEEPCDSVEILDRVFAILGVESSDSPIVDPPGEIHGEKSPWVLTIEDDEDVALALKMRLKEVGIVSVHAMEGTAGYRSAFMSAPSAIILDYELPRGNGDYVLRRLKESSVTADIPVIVLTGRKEAYIERQMRGMGANAFFTKPFHWKQIQETLENLVPAFLH